MERGRIRQNVGSIRIVSYQDGLKEFDRRLSPMQLAIFAHVGHLVINKMYLGKTLRRIDVDNQNKTFDVYTKERNPGAIRKIPFDDYYQELDEYIW